MSAREHVRLRGHHLLCLLLYEGKGYSRAFVDNMDKIYSMLQSGRARVQLVQGDDDICACCPNLTAEGCSLGDVDVALRDRCVREAFHLEEQEVFEAKELFQHVREAMTEEVFDAACGSCRWHQGGICSYERIITSPMSDEGLQPVRNG